MCNGRIEDFFFQIHNSNEIPDHSVSEILFAMLKWKDIFTLFFQDTSIRSNFN